MTYKYEVMKNSNKPTSKLRSQTGQIVVEYVLLLVVAVAVAAMISKVIVSRDPNNPGFIIIKWQQILNTIGTDNADSVE